LEAVGDVAVPKKKHIISKMSLSKFTFGGKNQGTVRHH
jgi:hypothetical protein